MRAASSIKRQGLRRLSRARSGGQIYIIGNDFRLDGHPIAGLNNIGDTLPLDISSKMLTGILTDGTPFAMGYGEGDYFDANTITLRLAPVPPVVPRQILASAEPVPFGIREGEVLVVDAGGTTGDHFNAGRGSVVNLLEAAAWE